jgi:hypothetical protein
MEQDLVLYFSGWLKLDPERVLLYDLEKDEKKTAAEFLRERGNIQGLIVDSFNQADETSLDGDYEELTLDLEEPV